MPHITTTLPQNPIAETWVHDREPVELVRFTDGDESFYIKIRTTGRDRLRLSLLITPIDLILNRHKKILLDAAHKWGVHILKSNLGDRIKPDLGLAYLFNEKRLATLNWNTLKAAVFEIGSGNGSFLCEHALRHTKSFHFGAEINGFTLKKALRKAAKLQLQNIAFTRNDALYLLSYHVPDARLDKIYINFPDPWEKKRYNKRRLIQPETLLIFARVLRPYGEIHFTTDHREYAEHTRHQFSASPHFILKGETDNASLPFATKYEQKWRRVGRRIFQLIFQKTEAGTPFITGRDLLVYGPFKFESTTQPSSGTFHKIGSLVVVFKDVYKGGKNDIIDTVINLGRFRWNILLFKYPRHFSYDPYLNGKFLTQTIKAGLETLASTL